MKDRRNKFTGEFKTKIALGIELIQKAVQRQLPFDTVLFDGWYLAPAVGGMIGWPLLFVVLRDARRYFRVN